MNILLQYGSASQKVSDLVKLFKFGGATSFFHYGFDKHTIGVCHVQFNS
jgi:hypothetical protein